MWNFGNIFLTAAIAVAGMSVGFPIGGGLAWIGGIVFNFLLIILSGSVYPGNQALLWIGVALIIVAILVNAKAYKKLLTVQKTTPKKGYSTCYHGRCGHHVFLWSSGKIHFS